MSILISLYILLLIVLKNFDLLSLGANKNNILMLDSKGVIKPSRGNLTEQKAFFANEVENQLNGLLAEALLKFRHKAD